MAIMIKSGLYTLRVGQESDCGRIVREDRGRIDSHTVYNVGETLDMIYQAYERGAGAKAVAGVLSDCWRGPTHGQVAEG